MLKRSCRILPCSLVPLPAPVPFQCFPGPVNWEHWLLVLSQIHKRQACMNVLWELFLKRVKEVQSKIWINKHPCNSGESRKLFLGGQISLPSLKLIDEKRLVSKRPQVMQELHLCGRHSVSILAEAAPQAERIQSYLNSVPHAHLGLGWSISKANLVPILPCRLNNYWATPISLVPEVRDHQHQYTTLIHFFLLFIYPSTLPYLHVVWCRSVLLSIF